MNINDIAQWVIDNRYPKSEFEKISDHELYYGLIEKIELVLNKDQFYKIPKETIDNLFEVSYKKLRQECINKNPMTEKAIELHATCETLKFIKENSTLENE